MQLRDVVLFQKSVVNMGLKLYNKVPENVNKLNYFKLFKKELKSVLLSHFFYSVAKFLQFSLSWFVRYFYQLHQVNVMISHQDTVLYWTVYGSQCFIAPYR